MGYVMPGPDDAGRWWNLGQDRPQGGFPDLGDRQRGGGFGGDPVDHRMRVLIRENADRLDALRLGDRDRARASLHHVSGELTAMLDQIEAYVRDPAPTGRTVAETVPAWVGASAFRLIPVPELAELLDVPVPDVEAVLLEDGRIAGLSAADRERIAMHLAAWREALRDATARQDHDRVTRIARLVAGVFLAIATAVAAGHLSALAVGEDVVQEIVKAVVVLCVGAAFEQAARRLRDHRRSHDPYLVAAAAKELLEDDLRAFRDRSFGSPDDPVTEDLVVWQTRIIARAYGVTAALLEIDWDRSGSCWSTLGALATCASAPSHVRHAEFMAELGSQLEALPAPARPRGAHRWRRWLRRLTSWVPHRW